MNRALGGALAAAVVAACGGAPASRATPAVLVVDCPVGDAALWIDERYVADVALARHGVRLPPGVHRVEVRHDRYHAFFAEVALSPGGRERVAVALAARLD